MTKHSEHARFPVRLYKFMMAQFAIECVESGYLKVTTIDELNDPFELCPVYNSEAGASQKHIDLHKRTWRQGMAKDYGIISFSAVSYDPVLWSHYAAQHTGVALEFHPSGMPYKLLPVEYEKDRVVLDLHVNSSNEEKQQALERVIRTKYKSWGYESEYRLLVPLSECTPRHGFYFKPISEFRITGVFLGLRCSISHKYMQRLLRASSFAARGSVPVDVCRMSPHRYSVITDRTCEPPPDFRNQRKDGKHQIIQDPK
jgi:hypothetical protein